ncbi:MAG: glycosyl hydrolase family 28-related protein [Gemmataceae bacterium]
MTVLVLLALCADLRFPADAGVVDVTKPPYSARGDGKADDTAAIQKALDDHPNAGAIIYLSEGRYLISKTLTWPKGTRGGMEHKNTILQGQGRDRTVVVLADRCPGFADPDRPAALLWTGQKPAQRFRNAVRDLTLDAGTGNPGAIGARFMANNQGVMRDVLIRGTGPVGLDLGYTDENGPCLIKNVRVEGFAVGVRTAFAVDSLTLEHVEVDGAKVGLSNAGQCLSVRGLKYSGPGVAVVNGKPPSLLTLIDADLACTGSKGDAAIQNAGGLFARDVATRGYARALDAGPAIAEYASHKSPALFGNEVKSLRLPVRETPEVPWDAPESWAGPLQHGYKASAGRTPADATAAVQAALDAGKPTVYLPRGEWLLSDTLVVPAHVRRVIGCEARLNATKAFAAAGKPLFRVEGAGGPVVLERLRNTYGPAPAVFVEHAGTRPLVLRNLIVFGQKAYRNTGGGPLFLEDVCGGHFEFGRHPVWARQLNVENAGTHVLNAGGTLWVLGFKTERGGTLLHTRDGGRSEILGGFAYSTSGPKPEPMFLTEGGRLSVTLRETCFNGNPFQVIGQETRGGETKRLLPAALPRWTNGAVLGLYAAE